MKSPPCVCEDESSISAELAGPQVCPDLGSRGPKLEVYECDTTTHTHTHTICCDCMFHKQQSLSLHAKPVWNPVKLQGFIDSQRHIRQKREAMYKATFYPVSQIRTETSQTNGKLSSNCFSVCLQTDLGIFFVSDFSNSVSDTNCLQNFVLLLKSETTPRHV